MGEGISAMIEQIIKRDGRRAPFEIEKIANAIFGAAQASGGQDYEMARGLAEQVEKVLEATAGEEIPTVEQIQDTVEKVLIESGHARTAKKYILYRNERTRVREMNTRLMKVYEDLTFQSSLENDVKRENANIDGDTAMGTMLKYGSEGAQAVLRDVHPRPGARQGAPRGRHPHPRPGFPDADHDLLPDRPAEIVLGRLFDRPRFPA